MLFSKPNRTCQQQEVRFGRLESDLELGGRDVPSVGAGAGAEGGQAPTPRVVGRDERHPGAH